MHINHLDTLILTLFQPFRPKMFRTFTFYYSKVGPNTKPQFTHTNTTFINIFKIRNKKITNHHYYCYQWNTESFCQFILDNLQAFSKIFFFRREIDKVKMELQSFLNEWKKLSFSFHHIRRKHCRRWKMWHRIQFHRTLFALLTSHSIRKNKIFSFFLRIQWCMNKNLWPFDWSSSSLSPLHFSLAHSMIFCYRSKLLWCSTIFGIDFNFWLILMKCRYHTNTVHQLNGSTFQMIYKSMIEHKSVEINCRKTAVELSTRC